MGYSCFTICGSFFGTAKWISHTYMHIYVHIYIWGFPSSSVSKESISMWETCIWFLGQEDTLEKGMATHSSILVCLIPWAGELGTYSPRGCKESDTTEQLTHIHKHTCTHTIHMYVYIVPLFWISFPLRSPQSIE